MRQLGFKPTSHPRPSQTFCRIRTFDRSPADPSASVSEHPHSPSGWIPVGQAAQRMRRGSPTPFDRMRNCCPRSKSAASAWVPLLELSVGCHVHRSAPGSSGGQLPGCSAAQDCQPIRVATRPDLTSERRANARSTSTPSDLQSEDWDSDR